MSKYFHEKSTIQFSRQSKKLYLCNFLAGIRSLAVSHLGSNPDYLTLPFQRRRVRNTPRPPSPRWTSNGLHSWLLLTVTWQTWNNLYTILITFCFSKATMLLTLYCSLGFATVSKLHTNLTVFSNGEQVESKEKTQRATELIIILI